MNTVAPAFLTDALPPNAAARLAVFGKHPAAADHLEDAGLSTTSLVQFKQGLYVDGLGEILGRRRWEKELENPEVVPWSHGMVCAGPSGWLAAFFAASSDAKGRRQYPLVAAGHAAGFRSAGSAGEAGEIIRQTLRQAQGASSVEAIRTAAPAPRRPQVPLCVCVFLRAATAPRVPNRFCACCMRSHPRGQATVARASGRAVPPRHFTRSCGPHSFVRRSAWNVIPCVSHGSMVIRWWT
jgi:hypothetical protein